MNLGTGRAKFKTLTGNYSLVNSDGSDNGADYFLNQGQKWLDDNYYQYKADQVSIHSVDAGDYLILLRYLKYIEPGGVTLVNSSGEISILSEVSIDDINYNFETPSMQGTGEPSYWTYAPIRLAPLQQDYIQATVDAVDGTDVIQVGDSTPYVGILLTPTADATYSIQIRARFYEAPLVDDTDVSFWTTNHSYPWLLASIGTYYISLGNAKGAAEMFGQAQGFMRGLITDTIQRELSQHPSMQMRDYYG